MVTPFSMGCSAALACSASLPFPELSNQSATAVPGACKVPASVSSDSGLSQRMGPGTGGVGRFTDPEDPLELEPPVELDELLDPVDPVEVEVAGPAEVPDEEEAVLAVEVEVEVEVEVPVVPLELELEPVLPRGTVVLELDVAPLEAVLAEVVPVEVPVEVAALLPELELEEVWVPLEPLAEVAADDELVAVVEAPPEARHTPLTQLYPTMQSTSVLQAKGRAGILAG
jgi:hypothetical protein